MTSGAQWSGRRYGKSLGPLPICFPFFHDRFILVLLSLQIHHKKIKIL